MRARFYMLCGVMVMALGGCVEEDAVTARTQTGGASSWMAPCDASEDCGPLLECLCGVCTQTCAGPVCGRQTPGQCEGEDSTTVSRLCTHADERARALCVPLCEDDAECGQGERCREGACEPVECEDRARRPCQQGGLEDEGICRAEGRVEVCVDGLYVVSRAAFDAAVTRLAREGEDVSERLSDRVVAFCGVPAADLCDGVDGDCDGEVDEDAELGGVCDVGRGVCRSEGLVRCLSGAFACDAVEAPTQTGVCDLEDDDCDGEVDEFRLTNGDAASSVLAQRPVWSMAEVSGVTLVALEQPGATGEPLIEVIASPGGGLLQIQLAVIPGQAPQMSWHGVGDRQQASLFYLEAPSPSCVALWGGPGVPGEPAVRGGAEAPQALARGGRQLRAGGRVRVVQRRRAGRRDGDLARRLRDDVGGRRAGGVLQPRDRRPGRQGADGGGAARRRAGGGRGAEASAVAW